MDDILQKDTQLNAQLGQVQLKTTLVRLTLPFISEVKAGRSKNKKKAV